MTNEQRENLLRVLGELKAAAEKIAANGNSKETKDVAKGRASGLADAIMCINLVEHLKTEEEEREDA